MKKSFLKILSIIILLLLLTHPSLSFQGASNGLLLWYQTVLPTLLPFMICSNVIVSFNGIHLMTAPFRPLLRRLLRLSDAGCYVLMCGLLCGYPMGAKTCSEFADQGRITASESRYLLSISNHPSPMFLLGYVAAAMDSSIPVPLVLMAVYLPIIPVAFLSQAAYGIVSTCVSSTPKEQKPRSFDESMMSSFEVMVKIGGYIMLFSIFAQFITQIGVIPSEFQAFLLGIVEITTGIQAVSHVFQGFTQGFILCFIICFGGICGLFQTKSVLKNDHLSITHYLFWKLFHSVLSLGFFIFLAMFRLLALGP